MVVIHARRASPALKNHHARSFFFFCVRRFVVCCILWCRTAELLKARSPVPEEYVLLLCAGCGTTTFFESPSRSLSLSAGSGWGCPCLLIGEFYATNWLLHNFAAAAAGGCSMVFCTVVVVSFSSRCGRLYVVSPDWCTYAGTSFTNTHANAR